MTEFYEKAVGMTIYVYEDDSGKVLDEFESWSLERIESKNVTKEEEELKLTFDDGSVLEALRSNTDRNPMRINFYPGDEEDNYDTSQDLINIIDNKLSNFEDYILRSITVGVLTDGEVEDIANRFEFPSDYDLTRIDFKEREVLFKIIGEEGKVRTVASYENLEPKFNLVNLKKNLMQELENFLNEGEEDA